MQFYTVCEKMQIGVLGISYLSAEIGLREQFAIAAGRRLSKESAIARLFSCVILSTCNRTEIYFSAENLAEAHSALLALLREELEGLFEHKLYAFFGVDCFTHLSRVAAGLDSVIVAESEIQRQVKTAYEHTLLHYSLPSPMHFLFQKSLRVSKQIRSDYRLAEGQVTIPKLLFQMTADLLKDLKNRSILFIGNSEINRQVISYFRKKGSGPLSLCTRAPLSAQEVSGVSLLPWNELQRWEEYDVVICGSNATTPLIHEASEVPKTCLIFDLGVPRNVDPQISKHPLIASLNMEEISKLLERKQGKNLGEIWDAESKVTESAQRHFLAFQKKVHRQVLCLST
ncbi:MAG: hypothetical protein JSS61_01860 [Verrucomicrobia bacterium]|nr:hypothetical protein [Verrucomicrobiota bacterium]